MTTSPTMRDGSGGALDGAWEQIILSGPLTEGCNGGDQPPERKGAGDGG